MNWARDNVQLSDGDLRTVFKYEPKQSTIIQMLASHDWRVEISSREGDKQWSQWIEEDLPSIDKTDSGLVLLLARRSGEPALQETYKVASDDWIERAKNEHHAIPSLGRADTFSPLQEKGPSTSSGANSQVPSGRRGVRTVPFSRETFERLTSCFHTHSSIARVVSRSDVPVFTSDKLIMGKPAYVYNCRSSNAWEMDLALTVTHFPQTNLTFAILFGCHFSVEKDIITGLNNLKAEAAHPLLMPGIFAELERKRHTKLVEEMGNKLEGLIFQLDFHSNDLVGPEGAQAESRSKEKRNAYLDLAYLRNSLLSWNTQLAKMVQHGRQLTREEYGTTSNDGMGILASDNPKVRRAVERVASRSCDVSRSPLRVELCEVEALKESDLLMRKERPHFERTTFAMNLNSIEENGKQKIADLELAEMRMSSRQSKMTNQVTGKSNIQPWRLNKYQKGMDDQYEKLRATGFKIESRLMSIRDEYDDKIRDCTMRVDGMAMSTQWSHGETNVEIALATNRDSRHMRSIALVTMIFLPGTFFASMFSMTFFNWSNDPGSPIVSTYLWIYVLITVLFTSLTIGLWYYIVVFRPSRGKCKGEEQG